jgi:hypothetical protein
MSNYVKATNFAVKDGLSTGNPAKIIKGTEIDTEYNAIASAISSKADTNSPTFTGTPAASTASAGTSTTQIATTAFVTTAIATAVAALVPSGMIMIWSGSVGSIPSGWVLCNGSNSTPDLRDKFVLGAGSTYAVAATGGATTVTAAGTISVTGTALTEAQMPKHFHSLRGPNGPFTSTVPSATASGSGNYGGGTPDDGTTAYGTNSTGGNSASGSSGTGTSNGDTHTHSASFTGSSVSNLPPYYALCYIMKT